MTTYVDDCDVDAARALRTLVWNVVRTQINAKEPVHTQEFLRGVDDLRTTGSVTAQCCHQSFANEALVEPGTIAHAVLDIMSPMYLLHNIVTQQIVQTVSLPTVQSHPMHMHKHGLKSEERVVPSKFHIPRVTLTVVAQFPCSTLTVFVCRHWPERTVVVYLVFDNRSTGSAAYIGKLKVSNYKTNTDTKPFGESQYNLQGFDRDICNVMMLKCRL